MAILPTAQFVQGPQGAGVSAPRTPIPFAAGLTAHDARSSLAPGVASPIVPPTVPVEPVTAGGYTRTTLDDWYYRIHIVPTTISLGNLSGDTTRTILVWNAFFDNVSLDSVVLAGGDGITLSEPVVPPVTLGALKSLNYAVSVSTEGPAVIDATITWTIDGVSYDVPITGRRSVLFPFMPTWRSAVQETLSWTTTVIRAWSGYEQRQSIARYPRRALRYQFQVVGDDARLLDNLLFGWQGRFYSLPLWHEVAYLFSGVSAGASTILVDTTRMSLAVGSTLVLYANAGTYETVEVETFGAGFVNVKGTLANTWPQNTKVAPCVSAIPQATISTSRPLPHVAEGSVDMLVDPSTTLLRLVGGTAPMQYRGDELYYRETDWSSSLAAPIEANRLDMDSGIGPLRVTRRGDYPFLGRSYRWVNRDRAASDALRAFFARRQGRFSPFWAPSGTEDFVLIEPTDPVTAAIAVRKTLFGSMVWPNKIRRDIIIKLRNGTVYTRRIINVADTPDTSVLVLDQGFGSVIDPTDVKRISYLGLYRLTDDSITFNWHTNHVSTVESDFTLTEPEQ